MGCQGKGCIHSSSLDTGCGALVHCMCATKARCSGSACSSCCEPVFANHKPQQVQQSSQKSIQVLKLNIRSSCGLSKPQSATRNIQQHSLLLKQVFGGESS